MSTQTILKRAAACTLLSPSLITDPQVALQVCQTLVAVSAAGGKLALDTETDVSSSQGGNVAAEVALAAVSADRDFGASYVFDARATGLEPFEALGLAT